MVQDVDNIEAQLKIARRSKAAKLLKGLVELVGIEPTTSSLRILKPELHEVKEDEDK